MKNIYLRLLLGIATTILVYGVFNASQSIFASNLKKQSKAVDIAFEQLLLDQKNEITKNAKEINIMELKIDNMTKYVEVSQKNLDFWLKLLTSILALLIGYSIFSGLKSRDLAKDELTEIRRIRDGINREAILVEDRLKVVSAQISQIEIAAEKAKIIERELTAKLDEFSKKEDIVLTDAQIKTIDEAITKTKEDLKVSGLESLKILYYAQMLKAFNSEDWEETLRLCNNCLDIESENEKVLLRRARAYYEITLLTNNNERYIKKSFMDYDEAIRLNPNNHVSFNNRGILFNKIGKNDEALSDYTESIRLNPDYALAYKNRSKLYTKIGKTPEARRDMEAYQRIQTPK